ncbi:GxxExxY protein [Candidatus Kuenenbacteria bacterium]|nr:GxxExxY protein [Candidatus Kuenenbacteria bacterium]
MTNIIHPELSYDIINSAYNVYNQLGVDHQEKVFHRAMAVDFDKKEIYYEREKKIKLYYEGEYVGEYRLDFIVGNKIIVELKVRPYPEKIHIKQVLDYLNATGLDLAILIFFTRDGVKYKRVVNSKKVK